MWPKTALLNVLCFTLLLTNFNVIASAENTPIITITELLPNPEGTDRDQEYVKIKNSSEETVDISLWEILDEAEHKIVIPESTQIASDEERTFYFNGTVLNNSGDTVTLRTNNGTIIDTFTYTQSQSGQPNTAGISNNEQPDQPAPDPNADTITAEIPPTNSDETKEPTESAEELTPPEAPLVSQEEVDPVKKTSESEPIESPAETTETSTDTSNSETTTIPENSTSDNEDTSEANDAKTKSETANEIPQTPESTVDNSKIETETTENIVDTESENDSVDTDQTTTMIEKTLPSPSNKNTASSGGSARFYSGMVRSDRQKFDRVLSPEESWALAKKHNAGSPAEIKTYINRNGFKVFAGYRSGRRALADFPYRMENSVIYRGEKLKRTDEFTGANLAAKLYSLKSQFQSATLKPGQYRSRSYISKKHNRYQSLQVKYGTQNMPKRLPKYDLIQGIQNRNFKQKQNINNYERQPVPMPNRSVSRIKKPRN